MSTHQPRLERLLLTLGQIVNMSAADGSQGAPLPPFLKLDFPFRLQSFFPACSRSNQRRPNTSPESQATIARIASSPNLSPLRNQRTETEREGDRSDFFGPHEGRKKSRRAASKARCTDHRCAHPPQTPAAALPLRAEPHLVRGARRFLALLIRLTPSWHDSSGTSWGRGGREYCVRWGGRTRCLGARAQTRTKQDAADPGTDRSLYWGCLF